MIKLITRLLVLVVFSPVITAAFIFHLICSTWAIGKYFAEDFTDYLK